MFFWNISYKVVFNLNLFIGKLVVYKRFTTTIYQILQHLLERGESGVHISLLLSTHQANKR